MENEEDGWKNVQPQCQYALDEYNNKTEGNNGWSVNTYKDNNIKIVGTKENFESSTDCKKAALIWELCFEI